MVISLISRVDASSFAWCSFMINILSTSSLESMPRIWKMDPYFRYIVPTPIKKPWSVLFNIEIYQSSHKRDVGMIRRDRLLGDPLAWWHMTEAVVLFSVASLSQLAPKVSFQFPKHQMSPPTRRLPEKPIVLVTGCASPNSLGSAISLCFLDHGFRVFATCRSPIDRMQHLKSKGCELIELTVGDEDSMQSAVKELSIKTGGYLDVLVNNVSLVACLSVFNKRLLSKLWLTTEYHEGGLKIRWDIGWPHLVPCSRCLEIGWGL